MKSSSAVYSGESGLSITRWYNNWMIHANKLCENNPELKERTLGKEIMSVASRHRLRPHMLSKGIIQQA